MSSPDWDCTSVANGGLHRPPNGNLHLRPGTITEPSAAPVSVPGKRAHRSRPGLTHRGVMRPISHPTTKRQSPRRTPSSERNLFPVAEKRQYPQVRAALVSHSVYNRTGRRETNRQGTCPGRISVAVLLCPRHWRLSYTGRKRPPGLREDDARAIGDQTGIRLPPVKCEAGRTAASQLD